MGLSVSTNLYSLLAAQGTPASRAPMTASECDERTAEKKNLPVLSEDGKSFKAPGTKLSSETIEALDDGTTRKTQIFEREDGSKFTRVEDFALTDKGSRRVVAQQNPSGNITQYEEVLDRQPQGGFRRTQRFRDESGDTTTQITTNYSVTDPFILTGGDVPSSPVYASPFVSLRGTQLDLQA